jgi:hypothetical protein
VNLYGFLNAEEKNGREKEGKRRKNHINFMKDNNPIMKAIDKQSIF